MFTGQCFFSAVFWGRNSASFPSPKSMFFSPILKENSPQNEALKKKSAKCDDSMLEVRINSFRALTMNLRVASLGDR